VPPLFSIEDNVKLDADRPFDGVVDHLSTTLERIAEDYLAAANVDLTDFTDGTEEGRKITLDDEFGPLTSDKAIEKTFRAAFIHVNLAVKAKSEGEVETAWARLARASIFVGRIERVELIEMAIKRQAELTHDLKAKTIELVSCLRPEGGWATHEAACKAVNPELRAFRDSIIDAKKRKAEKGKEIDLIQQMQRWRKDDPLVRAAFAGSSAKVIAVHANVAGK